LHKLKLNLCSIGVPTDPHTWSGTPFHIYSELNRRGQCAEAFNADLPQGLKQSLSLLSVCFYGKADISRAPIRRYASAFNTTIRTKVSGSPYTLHTSTLSLPFLVRPKRQYHYLFCDSTWNLSLRYATNAENYSKRTVTLFDRLERHAYSQMNHIFSISNYVRNNLIEYYRVPPEKTTCVGTGLGVINPFTGKKDYSARKILFTAKRKFRDKGGELVVEAFRKALQIDPKLELTIVGSEEARKFDKCPNITVLGFLPLQDFQELFDTHSLFLMPALNEPWGLVYLEAMACKMPIMGLRRNSFPEISGYGKYGFSVEKADPSLIANFLVDAFKNPERLKEMGEQAQAYCLSQFSWESTVNQILDVVERDCNIAQIHNNYKYLRADPSGNTLFS
jgi:glycosyltransferase involved in cell wall biosynthesis